MFHCLPGGRYCKEYCLSRELWFCCLMLYIAPSVKIKDFFCYFKKKWNYENALKFLCGGFQEIEG